MVSSTSLTPRQQLLATIAAAVRVAPAVVYAPRVDEWVCGSLDARKGFLSGAPCTIPAGTPIVLLATTERHWREVQPAWPSAATNHIHNGAAVTVEQRKTYFAPLHAELSCALREVHRRAVADAAAQRVVRRRGPAVGAPAPTWRAVRQTLGARRAERAEPPRGASAAGTALDQWPLVEGRVTPLRRAPPQPSTRRRGVHASQWSDQFTELI